MVLDALILFKPTMLEHAVVKPRHCVHIIKVRVESFLVTNTVFTNVVNSAADYSLPCMAWR